MGFRGRETWIATGMTALLTASCPWSPPALAAPIGADAATDPLLGYVIAPTSGSAALTLVPATNTRTYAGTVLSGTTFTRGVINISGGTAGETYTWTVSPATVDMGGNAFTITLYSVTAASSTAGLISASGTDTLYIGCTGAVASGTTAGRKRDTPTITITPQFENSKNVRPSYELNVVTPLTVAKAADLTFGTVTSTGTAGTVRVPAGTGAATATGGAQIVGGAAAGRFTLSGEASTAYTLSVSPSTLTLAGPGGATMTVGTWVTSPTSPGTLANSGNATVYLGGTLNVGASQAQGAYTGIVTLTANYQ